MDEGFSSCGTLSIFTRKLGRSETPAKTEQSIYPQAV
jgi:hypothetical protein